MPNVARINIGLSSVYRYHYYYCYVFDNGNVTGNWEFAVLERESAMLSLINKTVLHECWRTSRWRCRSDLVVGT